VIVTLFSVTLFSIIGNVMLLKTSPLLENIDQNVEQPSHMADAHDTASRLGNITLHLYTDPRWNETGIMSSQQSSNLDERSTENRFRKEKNTYGQKKSQRLEFIHIPKSGGTMLEITAAAAATTWGYCHFKWKDKPCLPSTGGKGAVWPQQIALRPNVETVPWHVPPYYFERKELSLPYNPYSNATLFTIVRNPFDRVISSYFYALKFSKQGSDNAKHMNRWITRGLTTFGNTPSYNSHLFPQYDYVFDRSQPNETRRVIDHVIQFEQLHEEFPALLALYNLSQIILPKEKIGIFSLHKPMGVANLTRETVKLIESFYAHDFEEFGYKTISKP
jgi:hypothetical protein